MSPWEILGIAPTYDAKAIKRAYASKLKQTKPDEDPEGFQALHQAYKSLSRQVKQQNKSQLKQDEYQADETEYLEPLPLAQAPDPEPVQADEPATRIEASSTEDGPISTAQRIELVEEVSNDSLLDNPDTTPLPSVEILINQLNELLCTQSSPVEAERLRAFLPQCFERPIEEKRQISLAVFALMLDIKRDNWTQFNCLLNSESLLLMEQTFNWLADRELMELEFDLAEVDNFYSQLIKNLDLHSKGKQDYQLNKSVKVVDLEDARFRELKAGVATRFILYLLDLVLFFIAFSIANKGLPMIMETNSLYVFIGIYFYYFAFCEWKYGATLAKYLAKVKVVTRAEQKPGFFHTLWRTISVPLSMASFKLVFFVHLYLWFKGKALHDWISQSYVVKR